MTDPVIKPPRTGTDSNTVNEWLDALSSGACDQPTFLRGVGALLHRAPDAGWELLALVDQYYRRNKISAETFGQVKAHLQNLLMGKGRGGDVSIPLSRAPASAPAPGVLPVQREAPPFAPAAPPVPMMSEPVLSAPLRRPARSVPPPAGPRFEAPMEPPEVLSEPRAAAFSEPWAAPLSEPRAARPRQRTPVTSPVQPTFAGPVTHDDSPSGTPQRTPQPGDMLRDRYRVQAKLGQGGMGTVFAAIDEYRLDRALGDQRVAIKVLHTAVIQRPRLFAELRREFQHLQSLSHPNIVRVHEFDRDGDLAFFTMEYLSGAPLAHVLSSQAMGALPRAHALAIVRDVGAAIAHAHARGVVHGDLNPSNIFITDNGEVRVLDFGASNQLRRTPWISEFENSQQMTVATPSYASCQLLEGEIPDPRDDVFALACVAYVLLSGEQPFGENGVLKARSMRAVPRRPGGLSREQWQALREGLHFDREHRPSDVPAWLARLDLSAASPHLPILDSLTTAPRRSPRKPIGLRWVAVCVVVALLALGGWWGATHQDSVRDSKNALVATLKTRFANTVISQLWEDDPRHAAGESGSEYAPPQDADGGVAPAAPNPAPDLDAGAARMPPVRSAEVPAATRAPSVARAPMISAPTDTAPPPPPLRPASPAAAAPVPAAPSTPSTARVVGPASEVPTPAAPPAAAAAFTGVHARLELAVDNVDVTPGEPMAHVIVRRTRSMRGDVSFSWWTESGTAKPGRDFTAVKSQVEHIEDGKNVANLFIPVSADASRHDPRSFYVVIDEASDNAALGSRTLTMVTLPGTE